MKMLVKTFIDTLTGTFSYVVYRKDRKECAVIDPVLGYDFRSGKTDTKGADDILAFIVSQGLEVQWLLETHMHADHLSSSAYLRSKVGGKIAASEKVKTVQAVFGKIYNFEPEYYKADGLFDYFFKDDENFEIAGMPAVALYVPGHTPADVAYFVNNQAAFVGDTLFAPDLGTARCDFPGGDAKQLFTSAQRILSLPSQTQLYLCHDYPPEGRERQSVVTVADQRRNNIHVRQDSDIATFVKVRQTRDATLAMPNLLLPSLQVNIRAGVLPEPAENGKRYLRIPLNED
ncbi:MBL fold metallo-hydrolase [Pseudomonas fluorescens]|uniref:Putative metallo-hydrolase n=1 Tax=Pseudomonas fluorescens TaxID=294 RepID=A0A5E7AMJ4_PSEFL|nr:MBL fold metallo-hydrolase [Pseudomonas fluorescens]VVN80762.1 putative metallo-hydrolase [Pseudomonas fluorescens]